MKSKKQHQNNREQPLHNQGNQPIKELNTPGQADNPQVIQKGVHKIPIPNQRKSGSRFNRKANKKSDRGIDPKQHWFIKKYATSVLMVYAISMIFLGIMYVFDKGLESNRIITAIGTGGILIAAGDLLRSPFSMSSNFRRTHSDLVLACDVHSLATDTSKQFIHGEKAQNWLKNKKNEAIKKEALYAFNEKADMILFIVGNILTTLGFSSLLLVFASDMFYCWVLSIQPMFTILSFIFLLASMMIKEYGEYFLEELSQEKEELAKMTSSQLQQEHQIEIEI